MCRYFILMHKVSGLKCSIYLTNHIQILFLDATVINVCIYSKYVLFICKVNTVAVWKMGFEIFVKKMGFKINIHTS